MKLVIVESPSKVKTIKKYLGQGFTVDASVGHIRDLPKKSLGVDVKNNFEPRYVVSEDKKEVIKRLSDLAKKAEIVYLATDPDREGEAISWHLANVLKLEPESCARIVFNEITESAVKRAIAAPRQIDMALVDAQQARRVLDRLVGYKISPFLCKQIQNNLSAGRVQSACLKMIVDREEEIRNFVPQEYWNIYAHLKKQEGKDADVAFRAQLIEAFGKKDKIANKEQADAVLREVEGKEWRVFKVKKGVSRSHAPAPFTTSTLQQDGSAKLSLTSPQVMQIAQQLYEGVEIAGEGQVALVTYIRTDSVRVSKEAQEAALSYIERVYGKEFVPNKPNVYQSKKSAQDAHEAIRPVNLERTPASIKDKVPKNVYRLYKLVYERFLASQMAEAKYNTLTVDVSAGATLFRATGKSLQFAGFTAVYESVKEDKEEDVAASVKMPQLEAGALLQLIKMDSEQKFTKPPARFTDATLVKAMEEKGIGRPSTYASIIGVLSKRKYTEKEQKFIVPTELAYQVNAVMLQYFDRIVDVSFTARMEAQLDKIEEGDADWHKLIVDFYPWLQRKLEKAGESLVEETDEICEKCGKPMLLRSGKFGKFLACSNYPTCDNTRHTEEDISDVVCEKCGAKMIIRRGKYGKYLACPNYPDCKNIKSMREDAVSEELCEKCGKPLLLREGRYGKYLHCAECKINRPIFKKVGECPKCGKPIAQRRSKSGKTFYGCSGYPECDFVSWDVPFKTPCPKCGGFAVLKKQGKDEIVTCTKCEYRARFVRKNPAEEEGEE